MGMPTHLLPIFLAEAKRRVRQGCFASGAVSGLCDIRHGAESDRGSRPVFIWSPPAADGGLAVDGLFPEPTAPGVGLLWQGALQLVRPFKSENDRMRTFLKVSFAEKDQVKALGARWDPARKVWYVENVPDLARFAPWIPALSEPLQPTGARMSRSRAASVPSPQGVCADAWVSGAAVVVAGCGCEALPWEHCEHTLAV